ncbi:GNAT family N-acetyltransferase [Natrarchaeobius oligotrophus]|uniref:GNAT family N-acetyltransferase n=1 Tax=Natrarchaeobius chitinivorans TaxID=1679083 RepID=A0A3N6N0D5_NATCH|nr:GNAT family N-acetyltransferase [Natrarchaeobius chitinivorans]RQH00907.1 GNAT family N-acetyltransferase [Natrarchaeobius chitinivorans]
MEVYVRTATDDDVLEVRRILDAAMLEPGNVETRIDECDVLVAGDYARRSTVDGRSRRADEAATSERLLGALVLEPYDGDRGAHVSAVGVRRRHRGRGIGRALIERALERERRLTVRFDERVRPFYERLGFAIEPIDGKRHRGVATARELNGRSG